MYTTSAEYFIMTGHVVDGLTSFKMFYTHQKFPPILKFVETAAIVLESPFLGKQKELIKQLRLHWGSKEHSA